MFNKKDKKEEVYSSTDLSDLLSSPVFYSVIALTFILGLSSIFGFFNNPRKLKTVVDAISQKILINPNSNMVSFDTDDDYLLRKYSLKSSYVKPSAAPKNDNILISYHLVSAPEKVFKEEIQRVSFDYDITSNQFWGNLDASSIESTSEESLRQNSDVLIIGAPISPDYHYEKGDSKYSMGAGLLRL
jgi:hypothetical protein